MIGNPTGMIAILVIWWFSVVVSSETVTVVTNRGHVVGQKNDRYSTFFGVPYARVDEDNPFGRSLDYPHFMTPYIANDSSTMCPQVLRKIGGTIQCLQLNIYAPHTASINNQLPVLVWFYGGGFVLGSAGEYGGEHLVKHGILVVTVNYRLGPYGFLCLDDEYVPGNQGLKDQIAALKWIKENIAAFGGDAAKVTIAGESYGGGAVDLHLYSSHEVLFDKVIIQSGSMFSEGLFVKADYEAAIKIAKYLGHYVNTTKKALKILAKEHPLNVMNATRNLNLKLTACKEKHFNGVQHFVNNDPYHLNNPERVRKTPIMIGYNSKESFGTFANKPKEFYDNLGDVFYDKLTKNFDLKDMKTFSDIVRMFYLGGKAIGPEAAIELSDFFSDVMLNRAAEWSVNRYVAQEASVYKYLFSYIGGSIYQNVSGSGAIHTEELKYIFEMSTKLSTDEQMLIRERMTTMWAQFVKFGNPTPKRTELLPVSWIPVNGESRPYLNIDVDMKMEDYVYHQRMAFWELFLHYYVNQFSIKKDN